MSILIKKKDAQECSLYTKEQFKELFSVTYCPTMQFDSEALFEKVRASCPWLLKYTLFGKEQRRMGTYLHHKLLNGYVARVAIKWIDETLGYGLFSQEEIPADEFVGVYAGKVRKIKRFHPDLNGYCLHYPTRFLSYDYFVIDALHVGNEMRFVNHSDEPNLRFYSVIDRGLQYIALFSRRLIVFGEELTVDYGKDYWRRRTKIR